MVLVLPARRARRIVLAELGISVHLGASRCISAHLARPATVLALEDLLGSATARHRLPFHA